MPKGSGLQKFWAEYRAGERDLPENIGKRGKDKPGTVRKMKSSQALQDRYYERTGRRMDQEMADQSAMVQMMFEAAGEIADQEDRFKALEKCFMAQSRFNEHWSKYTEFQLGTLQSNQTVEEKYSLDDVLDGTAKLENKSDE